MKHLTTFRLIDIIARTGSIRAAADEAALTASAVQRRVQGYEEELGFQIFERGPRGVRLNTAGEIVTQHIRETLAETERLQSRIADLSGLRRGHVSIGCSQGAAPYFLPEQIARYQQAHPMVTFTVEVLEHGAAPEMLDSYAVDIVLVFDEGIPVNFQILAGYRQRLVAVMAQDHPLAKHPELRLRQCYRYPVIVPMAGFGGRSLIDQALRGKTFAQPPVLQSNSFEYLKVHVAATQAVTFQIEIGAPSATDAGGLISRPIDQRDVRGGMLWLGQKRDRTLSVAVSRFVEQISKALATTYPLA